MCSGKGHGAAAREEEHRLPHGTDLAAAQRGKKGDGPLVACWAEIQAGPTTERLARLKLDNKPSLGRNRKQAKISFAVRHSPQGSKPMKFSIYKKNF